MIHWKSISQGVLTIGIAVLTIATHNSINTSPTRQAVIETDDGYKAIYVRRSPVSTDTKVKDFVSEVVAKCFTLTAFSVDNKSDYCQKKYFGYNAGQIYKRHYADAIAPELKRLGASRNTIVESPPIIIQTPSFEKPFYALHSRVLSTQVTRTSRPTQRRNIWLWVEPTTKAENEKMYRIIGIRL